MLPLKNFRQQNESSSFDKAINSGRNKYRNASSAIKFLNETLCNSTGNSVN